MSLESDYYRMQMIIGFSNGNPQQTAFLTTACVRWYINQIKNPIKPKIDKSDLIYFNKNNRNNRFDIAEMIQRESMIDQEARMKIIPVKITKSQRERTRKMYSGTNYKKDLSTLLKLYAIVGNNNTQLSVPPIFEGVELFGSPLNTHNKLYCSPFEIEKQFGSLGSFFEFEPDIEHITSGKIMLCNPPFDEIVMENMANKLIKLAKKYPQMGILITIPVWDPETQKKLNIKNYNKPFICLKKLIDSGLITQHETLDRFTYKYFDYYNNKFSPVCFTHLITMGQTPPIEEFMQKWRDSIN